MKVLSLFDGMSCGMITLKELGFNIESYKASEIDDYAIQASYYNFPEIQQLGDVKNVNETDIDLLIGGSPCFVAGTKVITSNGYKNIEDIVVGDEVLTHMNRYRKVLRVGGQKKEIYKLRGECVEDTLTTENHPYYIRENNGESEPIWKKVKDLVKGDYLTVVHSDYFINLPFISVENLNYIDDVYNIEVEEDNSYTANDVVVHNCQSFSTAGSQKGMTTVENYELLTLEDYLTLKDLDFKFEGQSYLFWEYVRILKSLPPTTKFLLENVKMAKKWEDVITKALGVEPININSNVFSAQNRNRYYWTNIPVDDIPDSSPLVLRDIIEPYNGKYVKDTERNLRHEVSLDKKSLCCTATMYKGAGNNGMSLIRESNDQLRCLTVNEVRKLQTVPDWYDFGKLSKTQQYKMLGNGWTIEVIKHILKNAII